MYGTYAKVNFVWRSYICDITSIGRHWASPTYVTSHLSAGLKLPWFEAFYSMSPNKCPTIFQNNHDLSQWSYYVLRRDKPDEWKCQPNKWLSTKVRAGQKVRPFLGSCFSTLPNLERNISSLNFWMSYKN